MTGRSNTTSESGVGDSAGCGLAGGGNSPGGRTGLVVLNGHTTLLELICGLPRSTPGSTAFNHGSTKSLAGSPEVSRGDDVSDAQARRGEQIEPEQGEAEYPDGSSGDAGSS